MTPKNSKLHAKMPSMMTSKTSSKTLTMTPSKTPIISYSFFDNGSYYEGTGRYHELFQELRDRYPRCPNKTNTCHYQNVLAVAASIYTYYQEDRVHPFVWFRMYSGMYSLNQRVFEVLDGVLYQMYRVDESTLKQKLDMLLDIAIFYAFYRKSDVWLIDRLSLIL